MPLCSQSLKDATRDAYLPKVKKFVAQLYGCAREWDGTQSPPDHLRPHCQAAGLPNAEPLPRPFAMLSRCPGRLRWGLRSTGQSMLARTHGQAATPTRLGKEMMVFVERLEVR